MNTLVQRVTSAYQTLTGKREQFAETDAPQQSTPFVVFLLPVIGFLLFIVATCYGASRLSWCYNKSIGASDGTATAWAILCFFFSGFYYPFYAIFLHSCTPVTASAVSRFVGGRRR